MKTVYKTVIALVLGIVSINYLLNGAGDDFFDEIDKYENNKYTKHIGEKYVIYKDTLTIVDYSISKDNFTLSDGRKINYFLVVND